MTNRKRREEKRNYFLLIIAALFWVIFAFIIFFVDPEEIFAIPAFLITILAACYLTFSFIFQNKRRGLISALVISIFLLMRYFGIGNILNLLLLAALAITVEVYCSKKVR